MIKLSLGGDKLFVEFNEDSLSLLDMKLIENISHDNVCNIFLNGPDFYYTILCDKLHPETGISEPDEKLLKRTFKELKELLKEYHSSKKSANSKAYIK